MNTSSPASRLKNTPAARPTANVWAKSARIARLIAEFHGGRISAANRDGGGGVILTLRFPLRAAAYNTGPPA